MFCEDGDEVSGLGGMHLKAMMLGILSSFFFAVTFVLNRLMSTSGGSWVWSASLRYLFMIPLLLLIVILRRNFRAVLKEMRRHPWQWMWWSFVGFGLFYVPLCFAASFSPAWLVAGTWQFTIIAGSLVVPLFYETGKNESRVRKRIPFRSMGMSVFILIGIVMLEFSQASAVSVKNLMFGMIPIVIATFAYPLGNRKMMEICAGRLDAYQRTLGMTLASLPLWIVMAFYQLGTHGLPTISQTLQSLIVAVSSGVVATVLFFSATDLARGNIHQLATVEATQSGEVVFTLVGEMLLIPATTVTRFGYLGLAFVVVGMILHSLLSSRTGNSKETARKDDRLNSEHSEATNSTGHLGCCVRLVLANPKTDKSMIYELMADCIFNPSRDRIDHIISTVYSDSSTKLFLVVEEGGVYAGIAGIRSITDAEAELLHIAVAGDWRGRGIGRLTIERLVSQFELTSITAETDHNAVGFYRRCGFQIVSLGEKYPGVERFCCTYEV